MIWKWYENHGCSFICCSFAWLHYSQFINSIQAFLLSLFWCPAWLSLLHAHPGGLDGLLLCTVQVYSLVSCLQLLVILQEYFIRNILSVVSNTITKYMCKQRKTPNIIAQSIKDMFLIFSDKWQSSVSVLLLIVHVFWQISVNIAQCWDRSVTR